MKSPVCKEFKYTQNLKTLAWVVPGGGISCLCLFLEDETTKTVNQSPAPPPRKKCPFVLFRCAKASLLLTGQGTQGVGFHHNPDWDVYKNDDWGRRREVLRRLVNTVGTWITRRRAGRRLAAIQVPPNSRRYYSFISSCKLSLVRRE